MPSLSIIIPVYNAALYIARCLGSVLAQSFRDFEVIIVNDGSTDGTREICENIKRVDSRVILLNKSNEGVARARQDGFTLSKAPYITFIDADDFIESTFLETLYIHCLHDGADLCQCGFSSGPFGLQKVQPVRGNQDHLYQGQEIKDLLRTNFFYDKDFCRCPVTVYLWGKLMTRELARICVEDGIGLWFGEDQVAVFDILTKARKVYVCSDVMYRYVTNPQQATQKYRRDLWTSQINFLQRVEILDKDNLITEQLPYRVLRNLYKTMRKSRGLDHSFSFFKKELGYAMRQTYIREKIMNSTFFLLNWKEKIKLMLLRKGWYRVLYFILYKK